MDTTSTQILNSNKEESKRTYRHWTTLEDRKLLQLRNEGMKFRLIAKELQRTPISVEKRYRKILQNQWGES
ncbi:SANT/Myb-like DNA-binding domain-containing protein [Bacillus weihaiensis]|uniref:SANT/Myb-like DNA-binding domain-containing protein n=1 Tax=Bacillus weihaiensis TaxID=1547283 RepID=UPI00235516C7|nr:SANT/Myb-like DNA-binding domain-containing protein [Bacillus weihaiensis]